MPIMTSPTTLAESATGASYGMIVQSVDVFGNFTNPAAINTFGVDRTVPTVSFAGGAGANAIITNQSGVITAASVTAGAELWSANDATTTVGAIPSGIVGPGNLRVINERRDAASSQFWCPPNLQFQPAAGACPGATGWAAGTQRFTNPAGAVTADPAGTNLDAYYGLSVDAADNAGNVAAAVSVNVINDALAGNPAAFGASFLPSVIPTSGAVTLNGSTSENLDLARAAFGTNYPALAAGATLIRQPWTLHGLGGAGAGGLTPTGFNFAGPSVSGHAFSQSATVARSIEQAVAVTNVIAGGVLNGAVAVDGFQFISWDVARNPSNLIAPAIGIGSTGLAGGAGGTAPWAAAAALALPSPFGTMTWLFCGNAGAAPCAAVGTVDISGTGAGAVATRTIQAVAGQTGGGPNPWSAPFLGGVKFYVLDVDQNPAFGQNGVIAGAATGTALVEVCTAGPPVNNQATNSWIYSCSYTPRDLRVSHDLFGFNETIGGAVVGTSLPGIPMIAIGFNTTANGLATQPVAFTHAQ
jgi:hypothetical protein